MQDALMKFEIQEIRPGCVVLRCSGGLSWEDRAHLAERVDRHFAPLAVVAGAVLDLSAVEFVNSAGVGALFQLAQRLRVKGGRLLLAHAPPRLVRLFRLAGLNRVAPLCDDVATALAELDANSAPSAARPTSDAR
ncbi:MAG: STAS domain-containing protein [Phycisphaerae bacterium]